MLRDPIKEFFELFSTCFYELRAEAIYNKCWEMQRAKSYITYWLMLFPEVGVSTLLCYAFSIARETIKSHCICALLKTSLYSLEALSAHKINKNSIGMERPYLSLNLVCDKGIHSISQFLWLDNKNINWYQFRLWRWCRRRGYLKGEWAKKKYTTKRDKHGFHGKERGQRRNPVYNLFLQTLNLCRKALHYMELHWDRENLNHKLV